jgi:hypothetical protein
MVYAGTMKILKRSLFVAGVFFALIGLTTTAAYLAIFFHLTNASGMADVTHRYLTANENDSWQKSEEWLTLQKAAASDAPTINKAASDTGVPARLIVAQLIAEQLRLYTSQREIFKQVFKPLNMLGVQSQFSWGVMGMKQDTAKQIEQNLTTTSSSFYLGPAFEHLLDFSTADRNTERFNRLTEEKNHYYSYLYAALYIRQIETQWNKAGFDISKRSEILSTLYNIGFSHSHPKANPSVGGAEITVGGTTYSFGELAYRFYQSNELLAEFPR